MRILIGLRALEYCSRKVTAKVVKVYIVTYTVLQICRRESILTKN